MTQAEDPLNNSTILGLVAMALAVLVVANDFTALSVALPAMEQDFGADVQLCSGLSTATRWSSAC